MACKTNYTSNSGMWSFTLAALRLDELHNGQAWSDAPAGVGVWATACGGGANIHWVKSAYFSGGPPPDFTTPEEVAAFNEWAEQKPTDWYMGTVFLYRAEVGAVSEGNEQHKLKCFGYAGRSGDPEDPGSGAGGWVGDTEWILSGSFCVNNLRLRMETSESSGGIYTYPRYFGHRQAHYAWYAETDPSKPTMAYATLGDMSASGAIAYPAEVNPAVFNSWLSINGGNIALNTSYMEIRDVNCTTEGVSPNCFCSWWTEARDVYGEWPYGWLQANETPPANPTWHCFNVGNTFCLHRISYASGGHADQGLSTEMNGPIRFNARAGRGGYDDFPIPSGWRCDAGVRRYINETETEIVWIGEETSEWYVTGRTGYIHAADYNCLHHHEVTFGPVSADVDEEWLVNTGELLEAGGVDTPLQDNRKVKVIVPSLLDPLSGDYWGDAFRLERFGISADIPEGYTARPTPWAAGDGMTFVGDLWVAGGDGGVVTRNLVSRYDARLGYLAVGYEVGKEPYQADWVIMARANFWLNGDPPEVAAACAVEDVTNYDNSRLLCLSFSFPEGRPVRIDWSQARVTIGYATYSFTDECYEPAQWAGINLRFGTDGFFEYEKSQASFEFRGSGDALYDNLWFDLAQMRRIRGIDLRHIESLRLTLPGGVTYRLEDMQLVHDPSTHGYEFYPDLGVQPATDPWNWEEMGMGFGCTVEGVPCLNIPNGTESTPFNKDIQYGIKQTQYLQWNPLYLADLDEPPIYTPITAINLNVRMVQILNRQEQLTASLGAGATDAMADDEGNSMGFLYPWDLARPTSDVYGRGVSADENSFAGAIHVRSLATIGAPLAPITVGLVWITHGRGQGMVFDVLNKTIYRSTGGSSDDPDLYHWQLLRKSADAEQSRKWHAIGSCQPDATGRIVTPPAVESDEWVYRLNHSSARSAGAFQTREYAYYEPYYGPPVVIDIYEDEQPLAGEAKDGRSAAEGRRHKHTFKANDPLSVQPTLLWDVSTYGILLKGASGDDYTGPSGLEHHSFVTTGASQVDTPVPLPPFGRIPDSSTDLTLYSVVDDLCELVYQDVWIDIDPIMTDPAPGLPTMYNSSACRTCGKIEHFVGDESDLVLMYALGADPYQDPRSMRFGFTYHSRSLDGCVWGFSALPRVRHWSSGEVEDKMTWQARINRGVGGTGFARYYRIHDDSSMGDWRPEPGFTGNLSKDEEGWLETLGADILEYGYENCDNDWLITKVTNGATGAEHVYDYSEYDAGTVTITANTQVPTRAVLQLNENGLPDSVELQVQDPVTEEWTTYHETGVAYEGGLPISFTTNPEAGGCVCSVTYGGSDGSTFVSAWDDPEGHEWHAACGAGGIVQSVTNPEIHDWQFNGWFEGIDAGFWTDEAKALAYADNELSQRTYYRCDAPDENSVFNARATRANKATTYYAYHYPNWKPAFVQTPLGYTTYYQYSDRFNVTQRLDALERATVYEYNDRDQLILETDPLQYFAYYGYDDIGRLIVERDKAQHSAYHNYDEAGNLRSVVDRRGYATYFEFLPEQRTRAEINALGHPSYHVYDTYGHNVATVDALGHPTYYEYDHRWRVVRTTDALGRYTQTVYDGVSNPTLRIDELRYGTEYHYNFRGQVISTEDAQGYYTYDHYDAAGNHAQHRDELAYFTYWAYDSVGRTYYTEDALQRRTVNHWDDNDRLTKVVDALQYFTYYDYDKVGNLTAVTDALWQTVYHHYDDGDRRCATQDALSYFTYYEHDEMGRQTAVIDPLRHATHYQYDPEGNQFWTQDPLGYFTYNYYDPVGRLLCTQDATLALTYHEYDPAGRQTAVVGPKTAQWDGGLFTYYGYDEVNNQTSVTDALGHTTYSYYDGAHRQFAARNAIGYFTYYEHDPLGRQTAMKDALQYYSYNNYDPRGSLTATTNPRTYFTYYYYDPLKRQFCTRDFLEHLTYIEYDEVGRTHASLDADHKATYYKYDPVGRMTATVAPSGGVTYNHYDARGQMDWTLSPDLVPTYFQYDPAGRQVRVSDLLGHDSVTYYDPAGQVQTTVDAAQQPTDYAYDPVGRLVEVTDPAYGTTRHIYDPAGRQRALIDPLTGTTSSEYDPLGQLLVETDQLTRHTYHAYDPLGRREWRVDPERRATYFYYDEVDRQTAWEYSQVVQQQGVRHGGLLIGLNSPGFPYAREEVFIGRGYFAYDENGNRTMMHDASGVTYWAYNAIDQLTSEEQV